VFIEKPVGHGNKFFIPTIVSGLVPTDQKQRASSRVKGEKNPEGPASVLDSELFQIRMPRPTDRVGVWTRKSGSQLFEKSYDLAYRVLLFVL